MESFFWGSGWGAMGACPALIELHHMRDPGVHLFDTADCVWQPLASS